MIVRSDKDREGIIEAGRRLGAVLEEVAKAVAPGVSTATLDAIAEKMIREGGDQRRQVRRQPSCAHQNVHRPRHAFHTISCVRMQTATMSTTRSSLGSMALSMTAAGIKISMLIVNAPTHAR